MRVVSDGSEVEVVINVVLGPWRLNREDRCWERWVVDPTDLGLVHVRHVWLPDPSPSDG